jgi:arylsulfatase A-like enzyme
MGIGPSVDRFRRAVKFRRNAAAQRVCWRPVILALVRRAAPGAAALGALLAAACGAPSQDADPAAALPPNVILIVLDTTRADHLSYNGWSRETTPRIDALARDAVDYARALSAAPWTLPSHMSIFTGLLPAQHGATWAAFSDPTWESVSDIMRGSFAPADPARLLSRRLQERGYTTVGFSNNPWVSERTGLHEGFDVLYPAWRVITEFYRARQELSEEFGVPLDEMGRAAAGRTVVLFEKHLRDHGLEEPFFLFFNFMEAHYPYLIPARHAFAFGADPAEHRRLMDPAERVDEKAIISGAVPMDFEGLARLYDAALRYQDSMLERVLSHLEKRGLYERSMIIVTSDHGEHLGEGGRFSHHLSVEEELLRVPLLIKYPQGRGAGSRDETPLVSTLDLYATILAAASGGEHPAGTGLSQDLARMDRFERSWFLAENYFSDTYLEALAATNPAFDLEAQRVVRRALYRNGWKYVFRDRELIASQRVDANAARSGAEAEPQAWLDALVESLDAGSPMPRRDDGADPEFLEALRALGYLGDEAGPE